MRALSTDSQGRPLIENGSMVWLTGKEAIKKMLGDRLQFFKKSCVFARDAGLDTEWLGGKGTLPQAQSSLRDAILETPGVANILNMNIAINASTRQLTGTIDVLSEEGALELQL